MRKVQQSFIRELCVRVLDTRKRHPIFKMVFVMFTIYN
jgi:hypothetical protein